MGQASSHAAASAPALTKPATADAPPPAPAEAEGSRFTYKPALDGVRAIAVLSVMAYHFGADWLPGGFLVVDTFFVLSGYLITSLLLTEWARSSTIHFPGFWARRARRLLPALLIVLTAVTAWAYFEGDKTQLGSIRLDSIWTLFYGANWRFIHSGQSYFAQFAEPSPLRHAWSLAIEEQFYLFWPLITFGALRLGRGRPRVLAGVCVVGSAVSIFLLGRYYVHNDPSRSYFGTDARASQLLIGCTLAIVLMKWGPKTRFSRGAVQALGLVGAALCAVAFAVAHDRDSWLYYGGLPAFAFCTALLVASIVQPTGTPLRSLLSLRPIRWIGQVSYGLYLWHWPVVVALSEARTGISGWQLAALRLSVTFGAATLSYYLVELPIRHGHWLKSWRAAVAVPLSFAVVAGIIVAGTANAEPPPKYATAKPGAVLSDTTPSTTATTAPTQVPIPTRWLLLGDSVANSISDAFQQEAAANGVSLSSITRPGCGLVTAEVILDTGDRIPGAAHCAVTAAGYESSAIQRTGANVVLWFSSWELGDHLVNGSVVKFDSAAGDALLEAELDKARIRVEAAGVTKFVLLTFPVRAEHSDRVVPSDVDLRRPPRMNAVFRQFAAKHPGEVVLVDLANIVCPGGPPCPEYMDGVRLRPSDGGHFGPEGARWLAPRLFTAVLLALQRSMQAAPSTTTTPTTATSG